MSRASNILDLLEAIKIKTKTRKPSKKRREADEKKAKAAEKEREQWRENTFPKPPFKKRKYRRTED